MKANFKTNILLKNIIGKDLITDDNLAVLELVKNSFDAGSPSVEIIFKNIKENDDSDDLVIATDNTSTIVIQDYGVGMDDEALINRWLNIAYSEKKGKKEDFGRVLAGNKGVGRFSCDRLGNFLTIYTRVSNKPYYKLYIDWRQFETEGQQDLNIQDIDLNIEEIDPDKFEELTGEKKFDTGTILKINYLRSLWEPEKIIRLRRELEKFINPNQLFVSSPFNINISAEEYIAYDINQSESIKKVNGPINNRVFDKLDFRTTSIVASISGDGKHITTSMQDRGQEIFLLKEANKFDELSNVKITIYYLNPYAKVFFAKQTGIRSKDFGSIFLFVDGFRIPPYGDDGDDWLGMELRKAQGYKRFLGTREVVGRIEVTDVQGKFNIISNRSGLVKNKAFEQLTKSESPYGFYYTTFRRLERFVVEGIGWDKVVGDPETEGFTDETYLMDDLDRGKKIISVINNIIDAKKTQIISLNINEAFVNQVIDSQIAKTLAGMETLIKDLVKITDSADPKLLSEHQLKLNITESELSSLMFALGGLDAADVKYKRLVDIKEQVKAKQQELAAMKVQFDAERKRREEIEAENARLAEELRLEQEKNTYLRTSSRDLSEDAKGLVHNIKTTSTKIFSSVDNLYDKIINDRITKQELLKKLSVIKFQAEKAMKISKIITRANFRSDQTDQYVDVVSYIDQYISIYKDIYDDSDMTFVVNKNNVVFYKKIRVLDLAVILDDLISNADKQSAKLFRIDCYTNEKGLLRLLISDDGNGLDPKFSNNPEKIFELGVTTTSGSGIGLHSVKTALKTIGATISFVSNQRVLRGATFEIEFK